MITIAIIVVYSHLSLPTPRVKRLTRQAFAIVERDIGVKLVPKFEKRGIRRFRSDDPAMLLRTYGRYFPNTPHRTFLIAPTATDRNGSELLQGMAPICGSKGVVTLFTWEALESWNLSTFTHEIGHMLGAEHATDGSVMHPAKRQLYFNTESIEEIRKCLKIKSPKMSPPYRIYKPRNQ